MADYYYVVFTPTCTKEAPATAKTCNDLATEWQLAVSDFVELNDNVDSTCDNLVVGQEVCAFLENTLRASLTQAS